MNTSAEKLDRPNLVASIPFAAMHLAVVPLILATGFKWQYAVMALVSYYVRMFGVTAGYHRYFSHRAYQTSRAFQFVLAFLAQTSAQKGALWWAANHRHHHRFSDQPEDVHSPVQKSLWWAHVGWIVSSRYDKTQTQLIRDFERYPELRFLNRFHLVPIFAVGIVLFLLGGLPWLAWGLLIPTVILWHGTFTINSLTHVWGKRRYLTTDDSRNNLWLALITCGEGWHNNHHFHHNTANQGWFWWEVDFSYYALRGLEALGLVWKLRLPPEQTRFAHLRYSEAQKALLRGKNPRTETPPSGIAAPMPAPVMKR
jgi:stearoyl-CoA desaturase (Delta-9 desaturase)